MQRKSCPRPARRVGEIIFLLNLSFANLCAMFATIFYTILIKFARERNILREVAKTKVTFSLTKTEKVIK